tara:strand:- start:1 stop:486 length:486 start_codon:yes stop_codon:yes gene_type:complete
MNPRNIIEGATFSPITLRRGKSYSTDFYNWISLLYRSQYGDRQGNTSNYRGTIVIDHLDRLGKVVKKYIILGASPTTYIPGSQLNAADDSAVSVETLMLDYEGYIELSLTYDAITAAAGSAASSILDALGVVDKVEDLQPGFTSDVRAAVESINARRTSNK